MAGEVPTGTVLSNGTEAPQSAVLPPLTKPASERPVRPAVRRLRGRAGGVHAVEDVGAAGSGRLAPGRGRWAASLRQPRESSCRRREASARCGCVSCHRSSSCRCRPTGPGTWRNSAWAPTPRVRPGFHDNGSPLTGSRAAMPSRATAPGPGLVTLVGVVLPAEVTAGVDRRPGDRDAVRRVAAGVVTPGRPLSVADGAGLPARRRVAHRVAGGAPGERTGGAHDEVRAVGREVDVTHPGVEHAGTVVRIDVEHARRARTRPA